MSPIYRKVNEFRRHVDDAPLYRAEGGDNDEGEVPGEEFLRG